MKIFHNVYITITVFVLAVCFLPTFIVVNSESINNNNKYSYPILRDAFLMSYVLLLPFCLQFFLKVFFQLPDTTTTYRTNSFNIFFVICLLIMDFIPSFLIFNKKWSYADISLICCVKRIFIVANLLTRICINFPKIWKSLYAVLLFGLFSTIQIFMSLSLYVESSSILNILFISRITLEIIFILFFLRCLFVYVAITISTNSPTVGIDRTIRNISISSVFCTYVYILYSVCSGGSWLFTNSTFLIFDIYATTVIFILISILSELLLKAETALAYTKDSHTVRSTLVRYLSHQLRTPVNTVALALQCLKSHIGENTSLHNETIELVDDAITAVSAVTTVLENIITYESLSACTLKIFPRIVMAPEFISDIIPDLTEQAKKVKVILDFHQAFHDGICVNSAHISIDTFRFSQVINTLVGNAIKYTKKGGKVTVSVEYCHLEKDHHNHSDNGNDYSAVIQGSRINASGILKIRVTDTGRGIAKETLPELFERSLRFSPGLEEKDQGSGLSLWITRCLVDLHRYCTLEVESEGVGRGTEFLLSIPFYEQHVTQSLSPIPIESSESNDQNDTRKSVDVSSSSINNEIRVSHLSVCTTVKNSFNTMEYSYLSHKSSVPGTALSSYRNFSSKVHNEEGIEEDNTAEEYPYYPSEKLSEVNLNQPRNKFKVLIVDDAPMTLKMIVRVMKSKCKFITEAKDGAEAVERMKEAMEPGNMPFHFVMMDYQMPVMDGPSAAKAMREMGFTGPIIGVTGNAVETDLITFLTSGANEVLTKPLDVSRLGDVLNGHGVDLLSETEINQA